MLYRFSGESLLQGTEDEGRRGRVAAGDAYERESLLLVTGSRFIA